MLYLVEDFINLPFWILEVQVLETPSFIQQFKSQELFPVCNFSQRNDWNIRLDIFCGDSGHKLIFSSRPSPLLQRWFKIFFRDLVFLYVALHFLWNSCRSLWFVVLRIGTIQNCCLLYDTRYLVDFVNWACLLWRVRIPEEFGRCLQFG